MGDYTATQVHHKGPLIKAPADGISGYGGDADPRAPQQSRPSSQGGESSQDITRDEIRQIIVEELRAALKA